jgi:hypothetical protein
MPRREFALVHKGLDRAGKHDTAEPTGISHPLLPERCRIDNGEVDHQGRLSNPPHHFARAMEILPGTLARSNTPRPVARYRQVQHRLISAEATALLIARDEGIAIEDWPYGSASIEQRCSLT